MNRKRTCQKRKKNSKIRLLAPREILAVALSPSTSLPLPAFPLPAPLSHPALSSAPHARPAGKLRRRLPHHHRSWSSVVEEQACEKTLPSNFRKRKRLEKSAGRENEGNVFSQKAFFPKENT